MVMAATTESQCAAEFGTWNTNTNWYIPFGSPQGLCTPETDAAKEWRESRECTEAHGAFPNGLCIEETADAKAKRECEADFGTWRPATKFRDAKCNPETARSKAKREKDEAASVSLKSDISTDFDQETLYLTVAGFAATVALGFAVYSVSCKRNDDNYHKI